MGHSVRQLINFLFFFNLEALVDFPRVLVTPIQTSLALRTKRLFFFLHEHELEKHKVLVIQPAVQFSSKEN